MIGLDAWLSSIMRALPQAIFFFIVGTTDIGDLEF